MSDDLVRLVGEAARGILARGHDVQDPWLPILEGGWIGIGVPEELGGQGGTFAEAVAVAEAAGAAATGAPVVESMLVGLMVNACPGTRDLLGELAAGAERATLIPKVVFSDRSGCVVERMVAPWGRRTTLVVLMCTLEEGGLGLAAIPRDALRLIEGTTLAGDPLDEIRLVDNQLPAEVHELDMPLSLLVGAGGLLTAARLVGAMRATAAMSVEYANQRVQFGRPIASFQALAHDLVRQAALVELADGALRHATAAAVAGEMTPSAAARTVASTVSRDVVRIAHQVHGAIGVTREHPLHRLTLRIDSWRDTFGTRAWWSRRVGHQALASDAWWDALGPEPLVALSMSTPERSL